MLARLIQRLIARPILLLLGLLLIALAGLQGWQRMAVDLLPDLDVPVVNIITHLPGASPQDVELRLSRPLESAMQGISGVYRVASTSAQGISQVSVQFQWGMHANDARQLVQARLAQIGTQLPSGVVPRMEQIGTTLQEVAGYTITADGDPVALYNAVRNHLRPRLTQLPGVSRVDLLGGAERSFVVQVQPARLMRLHLRLGDIVAALQAMNRIDVAGIAADGGREWVVQADDRIRSLDDLRHLPLHLAGQSAAQAQPLLLQDVATITEGRMPRHYTIHGNGRPAVALLVRKQPGANALDVVPAVDRALARLQQALPASATVQKFYDQSEIVARAKDAIVQDLWLGAALVVLVLYLCFGSIRPALVVAITIPASLLATLALMQLLGLSLNMITMTALALAIGMIVDDAIVVADSVARHGLKQPPEQAALAGAMEIAGADMSGTMTTLAAFLPLLLVGGMAALFMRPFGWTVSIALLISLLMSLTLVPALSAFHSTATMAEPAWMAALRQQVTKRYAQLAQRRRTVLVAVLLFVALAVIAGVSGRAALLPPMDEGSILVEYILPPGTSLAESDRIGDRLEAMAMHDPDVRSVYRRTGSPLIGYQIEGPQRGEVMMKLAPLDERSRSAEAILDHFRQLTAAIPAASFLFHHPTQEKMDESFSGLPALFAVTIYGADAQQLIKQAQRVETMLAQQPDLSNIINNSRVHSHRLTIRLRPEQLARYGLQATEIHQLLRAAGFGLQATRVVRAQETIPVLLRWPGDAMDKPERVAALPVPTPDGGWVPLGRIAEIAPAAVPASISRVNGERQITLLAEAEGDLLAVADSVQRQLNQMQWPAGYSARVSGQYPLVMQMIERFVWIALAAVALIYLIMVLQFGSWRQPLAVLAVIPVTLAGGLLAVAWGSHSIDASIGMGALTLIGVAVNNGIVLVDYANRQMRAGMDRAAAWQQAVHVRFRPVVMTSATTIASLLPITFGIGGASAIFQPFAAMVIGGLIAGTLATLLLLPMLQERAAE